MTPLVIGTSTSARNWRLLPEKVTAPSPSPAYHSLCLGSTGVGKSRLLASVFLQHHLAGGAVGLVDPHGDLSRHILETLAARGDFDRPGAFERLVYLPFTPAAVPAFNVLAQSHLTPHDIALSTLDALVRVWPDLEEAPLLRTLFLSAALTLRANDLPLTDLSTLLLDSAFRQAALSSVRDPLVQQTFAYFDATSRGRPTMAGSTLRRLFLLSFSPLLHTALSQPDNVFDIRRRMDEGTSVIVDLGGVPDAVTRRLLGALVLTQIEQAALSRATLPEAARTPWLCLVDEWPVVASRHPGTLASLLDQARKYGLSLWLVGQGTSQFGGSRLAGAIENCRLRILFRLGADSARAMARQMPVVGDDGPGRAHAAYAQRLQALPARHALVSSGTRAPQEVRVLDVPDVHGSPDRLAAVLAEYHRRYLRPVRPGDKGGDHLLPTAGLPFDRLEGAYDIDDDTDDWSTSALEEGLPSY